MKFLSQVDPQVDRLIKAEEKRQRETLMMIPSENMVSQAVEEAVGSCLGNKYAEGYPFKRYYQGQKNVDQLESLVQERARKAFGVPYVNVQPLSGSPANLAVYMALLKPGQKLMGLALSHGGHLTHGAPVSASAIFFKSVSYVLGKDGYIDYDLIERMVLKERPKLLITGITAYPRQLNWRRLTQIANKVKAWVMADIAHLAGLVLAGVYPSPVAYMDVVTTTTHKTLRGPRGALIMVTKKGLRKDPDLAKKIDKAVFPGLQGGPHMNAIAGIGVALKEAMTARFKNYAQQIVANSKVLAQELKRYDFNLIAGGSNTHLILANLQNKKVSGKLAAEALEEAGIVLNYNTVPYDPNPPFNPSGIRLGTPGITSRGMKEKEMKKIGKWMAEVVNELAEVKKKMGVKFEEEKKKEMREKIIGRMSRMRQIKTEVKELCKKFPLKKRY